MSPQTSPALMAAIRAPFPHVGNPTSVGTIVLNLAPSLLCPYPGRRTGPLGFESANAHSGPFRKGRVGSVDSGARGSVLSWGAGFWAAAGLTGLPAPEGSLPLKIDYVQTVSVAIGTHLNTIQRSPSQANCFRAQAMCSW